MAFEFRLEHEDGSPADPPTLKAAVPDWRAGNTIALGPGRIVRVLETMGRGGIRGRPGFRARRRGRGLSGHYRPSRFAGIFPRGR